MDTNTILLAQVIMPSLPLISSTYVLTSLSLLLLLSCRHPPPIQFIMFHLTVCLYEI